MPVPVQMLYVEATIPAGMTIDQYRASRTPRKVTFRKRLRTRLTRP